MDNQKKENIKNFIKDTLFPIFCLGCQREGFYLCPDCRAVLDISENNYCLCEKNPLTISPLQKQNGKCHKCQDKKLSGLYFALSYKERSLTKKLIHSFKYEPFIKELSKTLSSLIIEHLILTKKNTNDIWENSVLIPVPLSNNKLKSRGYNQSEELAKELSLILKIPVISDCLIKIRETEPQMKLKREEREKNLQNAFAISTRYSEVSFSRKRESGRHCEEVTTDEAISKFELKNKKIFLVDDVYTTGLTMQECASQLLLAGAKSVWGIVIARES